MTALLTEIKAMLFEALTSKKAAATVAAGIVAAIGLLGLHLDPAPLAVALSPLLTYIAAQGIADHGKEAAQLNLAAAKLHLVSEPYSPAAASTTSTFGGQS